MNRMIMILSIATVSLVYQTNAGAADSTQQLPTLGDMKSAVQQEANQEKQAAKDAVQAEKSKAEQAVADEKQKAKDMVESKKSKANAKATEQQQRAKALAAVGIARGLLDLLAQHADGLGAAVDAGDGGPRRGVDNLLGACRPRVPVVANGQRGASRMNKGGAAGLGFSVPAVRLAGIVQLVVALAVVDDVPRQPIVGVVARVRFKIAVGYQISPLRHRCCLHGQAGRKKDGDDK